MQKMLTELEVKIGEKLYRFTCEPDSPLEHAKEALFQYLKYMGQIEDYAKAQAVANQEEALKSQDQVQAEVA